MTIREVYNPNNHTWELVNNWSVRRFVRYWFDLLAWQRSRAEHDLPESGWESKRGREILKGALGPSKSPNSPRYKSEKKVELAGK